MRTICASLAAFLLCAVANAQDLTIISTVSRNAGAPETTTSYFSSDHLRIMQRDGTVAIFDLKSGAMTLIDANKKTYYVATKKDIDDAAAIVKLMRNTVQAQMKDLPPEQQQSTQQMLGDWFKVEVKKTGTSRTIAGYHCDNWTMTTGQFSRSEQCLTTELKFPERSWKRYKDSNDPIEGMMSMVGVGPTAKEMEAMREEMRKVKGFPLASTTTTTMMGRKSVTTSEVTAINRGPIPATAWAIPAGYMKVESPMQRVRDAERRKDER